MGNDRHQTTEAAYIPYFGTNHIFHIVPADFPLPESGIIGLPFLKKYERYSLTPKFLILGKNKLPLHEDGHYISKNSQQVCLIQVKDTDSNVWIEGNEQIPDGIYSIRQGELLVPIYNYKSSPFKIPDEIKYDKILNIQSRDEIHKKGGNDCTTGFNRILELHKILQLNHIEPSIRQEIQKIVTTYNEVFTLPGDPLPCTQLTEHEITLNSGKVVNLKSHKLPEAHRLFTLEHTQELLDKGIIRHSQSPFNSPLWVVPKKGNKLRMVIDYRHINKDTDQDAYP